MKMRFIVLLIAIACVLALVVAHPPRVVRRRDYKPHSDIIYPRRRVIEHTSGDDNVEDFTYEKTGTKFWDFVGEARKTYNMIKKSQKAESTEALFSDEVEYSFNKNGLNFWQVIDELQTAKKMYDTINKKKNTAVSTAADEVKEYSFDKKGLKFWEVVDELKKAKKIYDIVINNNVVESDDARTFEKRGTNFWDFVDQIGNAYRFIKDKAAGTTETEADEIKEYSFDKKGLDFWGVVDELKKAKDAYDTINKSVVTEADEIKEYSFDKKGLNFKQVVAEFRKAKKAYDTINKKSE